MFTILCIDDDPTILDLQKKVLESKGYTVLTAIDGSTGITLACEQTADVVVLDYKMPGMDGGQVAEVLLRKKPHLPIVVCTGFFDAVPEWLKWFAAAYVHKGDGPDALFYAIEEVIGKTTVRGEGSEDGRAGRTLSEPAAA